MFKKGHLLDNCVPMFRKIILQLRPSFYILDISQSKLHNCTQYTCRMIEYVFLNIKFLQQFSSHFLSHPISFCLTLALAFTKTISNTGILKMLAQSLTFCSRLCCWGRSCRFLCGWLCGWHYAKFVK